MANAQKYTRPPAVIWQLTTKRKKKTKGRIHQVWQSRYRPTKTHLNYNLAPRRGLEQIDFIRQRTTRSPYTQEGRCECHVFMGGYSARVPPPQQNLHVSPDKEQVERLFFERTYRFLCDRYGEQNVVSAYVHKDEKDTAYALCFRAGYRGQAWWRKGFS